MSPTQAREIIEAAAERIAEWKSRLRVNTGRGVESWDNKAGQMVSVRVPVREVVKEALVLTNLLWVNITHVETRDPAYIPTETVGGSPVPGGGTLIDGGGVTERVTGWFVFSSLGNLTKGEYDDEDRYRHSDDLVSSSLPGYFRPKYGGTSIAPLSPNYLRAHPPAKEPIPTGARYLPERIGLGGHYSNGYYEYGWYAQNRTTTKVTVQLAAKGYTPDYLDDRASRGLSVEFDKGKGIGAFDLQLRQTDAVLGPAVNYPPYTDEYENDQPGGITYYSNPLLSSSRVRVASFPTTIQFSSRPFDSVYVPESPGTVELMALRKV
jgi:hypothetical protein